MLQNGAKFLFSYLVTLKINIMSITLAGATIGAGIASAIGSLAGGFIGGSNSKKATKIAVQGQKDMLKSQQDFAVQQWNAQNEYNTPAAQMQRLRAAGINPFVALEQLESSNASMVSSPSAPSVPQDMQSGQIYADSFGTASSFLADSILKAAQVKNIDANTAGVNIQNSYLDTQYQLGINELIQKIKESTSRTAGQFLENQFKATNFSVLSDKLKNENELTKANTDYIQAQNRYISTICESEKFRQAHILPLEVNKLIADIQTEYQNAVSNRIHANASATSAQAAVTSANASMMYAQTNAETASYVRRNILEDTVSKQIHNRFAGRLSESQIKQMEALTTNYLQEVGLKAEQINLYKSQELLNNTSSFSNILKSSPFSVNSLLAPSFLPFIPR